ncbi:hypothetical protein RF11_13763 [Thelohanellus kitauei]|uniref:Peptidase A2 domain-containing protein n=1 Tax=Thelohanellus kitauei TaxID=669202 RepID=A0A0C2IXN8_THEKT|nr:hypothetical protein RF11_13763 [Thelohanellus kitauei]
MSKRDPTIGVVCTETKGKLPSNFPVFDGSMSVDVSLKKVSIEARRFSIPDDHLTLEAMAFCSEDVLVSIELDGLTESSSYPSLVEFLKRRYGPVDSEFTFRDRFNSRLQREEESVAEFMESLKLLGNKAFKSFAANDRDGLVVTQFFKGLRSQPLSTELKKSGVEDIRETLQMAVKLEPLIKEDTIELQRINALHLKREDQSRLGEVEKKLNEQTELVKNFHVPASTPQIRCHNCGWFGHVRRFCKFSKFYFCSSFGVEGLFVNVSLNGSNYLALIDTGASRSVVVANLVRKEPKRCRYSLITATGSRVPVNGCSKVEFYIEDKLFSVEFLIVESLSYHIILGMDFLRFNEAVIDIVNGSAKIGGCITRLYKSSNQISPPEVLRTISLNRDKQENSPAKNVFIPDNIALRQLLNNYSSILR